MAYFKLTLKPGIDKQNTEYGAEGGWIDSDNVRFRYGLPEKIGGWNYLADTPTYFVGFTSDIFTWNILNGTPYIAVATSKKIYASFGNTWGDITPIRATTAAGGVTFSATAASATITVSDTSHGAIEGDFVTFSGASSLGGDITADILNSEWQVTSVLTANTYTITAPVPATASDTGNGGAAVVGAYQISVGSDTAYFSFGWGLGTWGESTWGTPREESSNVVLYPRIWKFDNYGQNLIIQQYNGAIYEWNPTTGLATRATAISGAPTASTYALVSSPDRHLICFGTESTIGDPTTQDPLFVRFSDQENINTFVETATNTAGGQRLSDGNKIVTAIRSRGQILIFTDSSMHAMQYVGPPYTFGFQQLGTNCGAIGPHCAVDVNGLAFWMGHNAFYVFDGTVKKMACTVQDFVFKDFNATQETKFSAALNTDFNEVTWFYCSAESDYIDRSVTFNYLENVWSTGTLARTAWQDTGVYPKPLAAEFMPNSSAATLSTIYGLSAGRSLLYMQEDGTNAADGSAIVSYIESGYFDIGDGDNMLLMSRFIPDFKDQSGDLRVNLFLRPYPQASASSSSLDPYPVTPTTDKVDTRARGRQIAVKITGDEVDSWWRYGTLRVDVQPDGLR